MICLVICTYNATTFHETFIMNIPTILCWDERYFELKPEIIPIFMKLKANIYFNDHKKAAKHINHVWKNIDTWWEALR